MSDALDGLINAHVQAIRSISDDGLRLFAVGIANDTLEFAATEVETLLPAEPIEVRNAVSHFLRSLKR